LLTVAVKAADLPVWTVALCGETPTETGAERVITAAPLLVLSAIDLAVRVTEAGLGSVAGAAYRTDVAVALESVPQALPVHPVPVKDQVTPCDARSFCTVAVKDCVPMPV
jgi:hypothetical protein